MGPYAIIIDLRRRGFQVSLADADHLIVNPIEKLPDEDVQVIWDNKPSLLRTLKSEIDWEHIEERASIICQTSDDQGASWCMSLAYSEQIGDTHDVVRRWIDLIQPIVPTDSTGELIRTATLELLRDPPWWLLHAIGHGWSERELTGWMPGYPKVRVDAQGVLPSLAVTSLGLEVDTVEAEEITYRAKSGSPLTRARRLTGIHLNVPMWEALRHGANECEAFN